VRLRVAEVVFEIVDDIQRSAHAPPMPRVGADIRVNSRLLRCRERQALAVAWLKESTRQKDFLRGGYKLSLCRSGVRRRRLGQRSDLFESPGLRNHEVVRHEIVIFEEELHGFP